MVVQVHELKPGDHIYVHGIRGVYDHHGIYVGKAKVKNPNTGKYQQLEHGVIHLIGYERNVKCKKCSYKGQKGIVLTCIDCFHEGNPMFRYEYGVSLIDFNLKGSGSCSTLSCSEPETVTKRANDYYEGNKNFGEYSVLFNNCEHFATKCKTGSARCNQASYGTGLPGAIVYNVAREFAKGFLW